jgi:8-oxo-dGTP pyrophosphatase MutT (NUDIX family)
MDLSILSQKYIFPSFVSEKLSAIPLDYDEKYERIKNTTANYNGQLGAGVVLLLHYKKNSSHEPEYFFQLIKRSSSVSQAGDISCPGGMLHPGVDRILSFLLAGRLISTMPDKRLYFNQNKDKDTVHLIHLFLTNALREAWEEIGLNPFNVSFLGALPCYSLLLFARTIFPLVCTIRQSYECKLSSEVDTVIEIPVSSFFDSSNFGRLEIEMPSSNLSEAQNNYHPCFIFSGPDGAREILWGATYNIIMNFLHVISDNCLPVLSADQNIKKVLSINYVSGYK